MDSAEQAALLAPHDARRMYICLQRLATTPGYMGGAGSRWDCMVILRCTLISDDSKVSSAILLRHSPLSSWLDFDVGAHTHSM